MKEIRYRAWDKQENKWVDYPIYIDGEGNIYWENYERGLKEADDIIVMQSTGLVDQNGVEIFDRSIIAIENHPFQKTDDSDVGMEINGNYEVIWNEDDLTWCAGNLLLARVKSYVRVIGNVYENSELLEA